MFSKLSIRESRKLKLAIKKKYRRKLFLEKSAKINGVPHEENKKGELAMKSSPRESRKLSLR